MRLNLSGATAVHEAALAARNFAERAGINDADSSRLAIVVEELVTNLYDHGGLTADDVFVIELDTTDKDISVVVIDPGRAFNPALAPKRGIPPRGGGAGLKLVRAWASQVDYQTTDGHNRLTVLLPSQ